MKIKHERNKHLECRCNRCGSSYELEPSDIEYEVEYDKVFTRQFCDVYKFYVKCINCGYRIKIHKEIVRQDK